MCGPRATKGRAACLRLTSISLLLRDVSTVTASCLRFVLNYVFLGGVWWLLALPSTAIRSLSSCCRRLCRSSSSNSRALKHSTESENWQSWFLLMNLNLLLKVKGQILTISWVQIHIEPESSSAGPAGTTAASEPGYPVYPVLQRQTGYPVYPVLYSVVL